MAQERLIDLVTPLGTGTLLPIRVQFHDRLARVFELHIDAISKRDDLDANAVLGQGLGLTLELPEGKRHFHAIATQFSLVGMQGRYFHYRIEARPWLWLLSLQFDCQIFQQLSVPDILKKIFADYPDTGVDFQLTGSYQPRDYCVQYRESDFDFVSRLMEEEGIYYFFKHTADKHTLTVVDSASAHAPFPGYDTLRFRPPQTGVQAEAEHITEWRMTHRMHTGISTLDDYDFEKPSVELRVKREDPRDHREAKREAYDYPGEYLVKSDGENLVRVRQEEQRARGVLIEAAGTARGLVVGSLFKLADFSRADQNQEHLVLETEITITDNPPESGILEPASFDCRFSAMPSADPFRPERSTPRPMVRGPQTAVVVGPGGDEIYTDKYGRVKVQFHWDRDGKKDQNASCWVRVAQVWAGKNWGWMTVPRIGQEVIVDFLEGNPDQPIITGRVYNAEQMPPWALPANKTQSGILTRSSPGGSAANANELRFEDKKGSEQVYLHAEKNQDIEVENDETHWVGHDRSKTIDHDETSHIKHDRTETVDNNETISIHGNRTETVDKEEKITVHGGRTEVVDKNESITIHGARTETVDKDEGITIRGARTEKVDKNETITIDGARTETVAKDEKITINGGRTETVAKDETITINGGRTEKVAKDESITISGGRAESVTKDESVTISGARKHTVSKSDNLDVGKTLTINAGDAITITTGSASISMKKDGTIAIKGKDISIDASGEINVKASKEVVIKGSKVNIN